MNTLFFTHQHRRSTKTLRLHYGLEGMKYIIQVYEGEINGHGEKEGLPNEYQYEFDAANGDSKPRIFSPGPDGETDTDDDIANRGKSGEGDDSSDVEDDSENDSSEFD